MWRCAMTKTEKLIFGLMVIPATLCLFLMDSDYEVEVQEAAAYCEMVEIWMNDPRPEIDRAGWPDYKGTYQEFCK